MLVRQMIVVYKNNCHNALCPCGTVEETAEGIMNVPSTVLDPEDGQGVYLLAHVERLPALSAEALATLVAGEVARQAKSKLTDDELAALGLTR